MVWKSALIVIIVAIGTLYLLQVKDDQVTLDVTVEADLDTVYDFWIDLSNLKRVHPFVKDVESLGHTTVHKDSGPISIETVQVQESLDYMPIDLHFTFTRETRKTEGKYVVEMGTSAMGGLFQGNTTMVFSSINEKVTLVQEFSHIKVIRLFESYTVNSMTKAHKVIMQNSKRIIENK